MSLCPVPPEKLLAALTLAATVCVAGCGEPYDHERNMAEWAAIATEPAFCRADNLEVGRWRYTTEHDGWSHSSPATAARFHLANAVLGLKSTGFDSIQQKNVVAVVLREEDRRDGAARHYRRLIGRLPMNLREGIITRARDRDVDGFEAYRGPTSQGLDYIARDRSAYYECFDHPDRVTFPNPSCRGYVFAAAGVQPTAVQFSTDASDRLAFIHAEVVGLARHVAEGCRTASGYPGRAGVRRAPAPSVQSG